MWASLHNHRRIQLRTSEIELPDGSLCPVRIFPGKGPLPLYPGIEPHHREQIEGEANRGVTLQRALLLYHCISVGAPKLLDEVNRQFAASSAKVPTKLLAPSPMLGIKRPSSVADIENFIEKYYALKGGEGTEVGLLKEMKAAGLRCSRDQVRKMIPESHRRPRGRARRKS
jgi:hypothetical protein